MMTRKDYKAIAAAIRESEQFLSETDPWAGPAQTAMNIAHRIANYCRQDNPRFDEERFINAAFPWLED